jgi:hypothetical protein
MMGPSRGAVYKMLHNARKKMKHAIEEKDFNIEQLMELFNCQEKLDAFAEQVLAGKDLGEAVPLVHAHLQMCGECRGEFEALLETLNAQKRMKGVNNP